ncbi:hypothetical protein BCV72DRAFT_297693 [Rhizopus microsporus var. microsporus]|uniref:Uncharacterized protein n=1 Tax=Rhizopus microsporus var. microsporus TaxID=86635 RepID=A0A1X0QS00_RHIZD|nr:hypothetical protein BCV72DRAFT_297693 [Rhizopus microsporus var. microsporus]
MERVPEDLFLFKLPDTYRPGSDKLSKSVAKHQAVVDLVTKALLNVSDNTYTAAETEWPDNICCDILYLPRLALNRTLPPVMVEIQSLVNQDLMNRAIQCCLHVYRKYEVLSVLLIVCTEKLSSCRLMDSFTACCDKPFLRQSSSNFWAQHCFLLSKSTIEHFANANGNPDPLVALSMLLTYKKRCIMKFDRWDCRRTMDDPTIVALYSITKPIFEHIRQGEDEKLEALQTVC